MGINVLRRHYERRNVVCRARVRACSGWILKCALLKVNASYMLEICVGCVVSFTKKNALITIVMKVERK